MSKKINARVKELREAIGLSAFEFSAKTPNLSNSTLVKIESDTGYDVSDKVISAICTHWEVPESWLRDGVGKMKFNKDRATGIAADIYRDVLYKELKETNEELKKDKNYWQQQYDKVFGMLASALPMGKLKSLVPAGFFKKDRTGARV